MRTSGVFIALTLCLLPRAALAQDALALEWFGLNFTDLLCSVGAVERVLAEARRVLKPEGTFLFCEHGLSPDGEVARWQRRLDPVWKHIAGNCHLSRPVAKTIAANGFAIADVDTMYLPKTPRFAGWNEWGSARVA